MSNTPNPVVSRREFDTATEVANSIATATITGTIALEPATLDDGTRVIVLVASTGDGAVVPLAIVLDTAQDIAEDSLFFRLTPLPEHVAAVLEDSEDVEAV